MGFARERVIFYREFGGGERVSGIQLTKINTFFPESLDSFKTDLFGPAQYLECVLKTS